MAHRGKVIPYRQIKGLEYARPSDEQRADVTLAVDPGLQALESDIEKYIAAKGNTGSRPDDWLDINSAKTIHQNIQKIRNEHLHMSCRFNSPVKDFGYTPRIKNNRRRRFYYEG